MAEDLHNPLSTPGAEPVTQDPTPHVEASEPDSELEDFLDDIFETSATTEPDDEPAATPAQAEVHEPSDVPAERTPPRERPSPATQGGTLQPVADAAPEPATSDDLQRQVLERLNAQLERMNQPQEPEQPRPQDITPAELIERLRPRIQQYIDAGWINEDAFALWPEQIALQVHMYDQLQNGTRQLQETQQFTQGEQTRRTQESAQEMIYNTMTEVAGRGEVFEALKDKEVQTGFLDFLVNDVNPVLSQVTPDFLARQFYAYNHELILDIARQAQTPQSGGPSAASLAQQEGGSTRGTPASANPPEFADLFEGMAASRWYT